MRSRINPAISLPPETGRLHVQVDMECLEAAVQIGENRIPALAGGLPWQSTSFATDLGVMRTGRKNDFSFPVDEQDIFVLKIASAGTPSSGG